MFEYLQTGNFYRVGEKVFDFDFSPNMLIKTNDSALEAIVLLGIILSAGCCAFLAIVFMQSAYDKLSGYKGNLDWLKGHFAKSPFKNSVPALLAVLTASESLSGLACAAGALFCWTETGRIIGLAGLILAVISLLSLLLGQRLAKDYAGAASLTGYFLVAMLGIIGTAFTGVLGFAASRLI
ncbi:MAG: DoxX family protein [Bacteroidia bacterium]